MLVTAGLCYKMPLGAYAGKVACLTTTGAVDLLVVHSQLVL
jgi:hypothetical protein